MDDKELSGYLDEIKRLRRDNELLRESVARLETYLIAMKYEIARDPVVLRQLINEALGDDEPSSRIVVEDDPLRTAALSLCESLRHWHDGKMECDSREHYALEIALAQSVVQDAAVTLGRKGGLVKSERKAAASRDNGRKGGRPRKA